MVVQTLLDSFSRCFGAPGQTGHSTHRGGTDKNDKSTAAGPNSTVSRRRDDGNAEEDEARDSRRRQGRALGLELHDQEWDALFQRDADKSRQSQHHHNDDSSKDRSKMNKSSTPSKKRHGSSGKHKAPDMDVGYADVLAHNQEAAKPSRHATPRKTDRKSDIFRSRVTTSSSSFASKFYVHDSVFRALCFANPVTDCNPKVNKDLDVKIARTDTMDHTVNTADHSMDSTLYFEQKYNQTQSRPPMPLFSRYKVGEEQGRANTLLSIVSSGSHRSIHMIQNYDDDDEDCVKDNSPVYVPRVPDDVPVIPVADDILRDMEIDEEKVKSSKNKAKISTPSTPPTPTKSINTSILSSFVSELGYRKGGERPPAVQAISETSLSTAPSMHSASSGKGNRIEFHTQPYAV